MANLKVVFKNTFLYSSSSLLLRASSLYLFPIFSSYLTTSDYGITSITQGLTAIIATFSGLQLGAAVTRFAFRGANADDGDDARLTQILRAAFTITFVVNFLVFVVLALFGSGWLKPVLNDISFYPYLFFALLAMPVTSVFDLYKTYLKARHRGGEVFWIDMVYFGGNIGLNLFFVIVFKLGALGLIYSTLVNSVVFVIYFLFRESALFVPTLDIKPLKPLLKYSLTFIPFILAGFLMENADRLFLNSKTNSAVSGIYYIAITFAAIFSTVKESLVSALTPWFFDNFTDENFKKIENLFSLIFWGAALIAVGISLFSFETLYVLSSNPEFVQAWRYIPIFVIGLFIVFIGQLCALPIYHSAATVKYLFVANLTGFVTTLIGCFFLIEKFDLLGAGVSKILGYTVMTVTFIIINNLTTKFRTRMLHVILSLIFVAVASFGNWVDLSFWVKLVAKIAFMIASFSIFGFFAVRYYGGLTQIKQMLGRGGQETA